MKTLTPDDIEKLPFCEYDPFGHCSEDRKKDFSPKICVMCVMDSLSQKICSDDMGCAGRSHMMLMRILKDLDVLPESVKFK